MRVPGIVVWVGLFMVLNGLLWVAQTGRNWGENRALEERKESLENEQAALGRQLAALDARFSSLEGELAGVEACSAKVEEYEAKGTNGRIPQHLYAAYEATFDACKARSAALVVAGESYDADVERHNRDVDEHNVRVDAYNVDAKRVGSTWVLVPGKLGRRAR